MCWKPTTSAAHSVPVSEEIRENRHFGLWQQTLAIACPSREVKCWLKFYAVLTANHQAEKLEAHNMWCSHLCLCGLVCAQRLIQSRGGSTIRGRSRSRSREQQNFCRGSRSRLAPTSSQSWLHCSRWRTLGCVIWHGYLSWTVIKVTLQKSSCKRRWDIWP